MTVETLGRVSFPSGRAVLIDTGILSQGGDEACEEFGRTLDGVAAGTFAVLGTRVGSGDYADSWREIWVELASGEVATREEIGRVVVDFARLMFIDAGAAAAWDETVSLDGKADFLFWGRDAGALAEATRAPPQGDGQFGWCDRAVAEAIALGTEAERLKEERGWKLATDFRPHTNHYLLLAQARDAATGSGEIELGGARACLFFTSWGDGVFPVYVDRGARGELLRFRVAFGAE